MMATVTRRTCVLRTPIASVDNLEVSSSDQGIGSEGFSPEFQVCLPYRGLFVWHVGGDAVVGEANQVLYVSGGESYRVSQPNGGYAELIITPNLSILSDLARADDRKLLRHSLFVRRSRRADATLQQLRTRLLHQLTSGHSDALAAEEVLAGLLGHALESDASDAVSSAATRRLVVRAKLFLEAHLTDPVRLDDVAQAVGASPAYLTDVFRRLEGVPLHKYLIQLRLARALIDLPHTNDLTALALDLGFSSHSHFAAAFRKAFGCPPSAFRELTRAATLAHVRRYRSSSMAE